MHRKRKKRMMLLIPWTGLALTAIAASETCYVTKSLPCVTAGGTCNGNGTIQANGRSWLQCTTGNPGNQTCSTGGIDDCAYTCVQTVNGQPSSSPQTASVPFFPSLSGGSC
jgi:hypothetical protein